MTPTPRKGILHGLPMEEYQAGAEVSNGKLAAMAISPAYYYGMNEAPNRPERAPTAAMLRGTLAHCAILEPGAMEGRYLVVPEDAPRRPSKVQWSAKKPSEDSQHAMAWWTDFQKQAGAREIVSAADYAAVLQQREAAASQQQSIYRDSELADLMSMGKSEVSAFWTDKATGLPCRCRPDHVRPLPGGRVKLLDLKSMADPYLVSFQRSVARLGYHRLAAFYIDGFEAASGLKVEEYIFGAVSSGYPFVAIPYVLMDDDISQGRDEYRDLIQQFKRCRDSNHWPAHSGGLQIASLPGWAKREPEIEVPQ